MEAAKRLVCILFTVCFFFSIEGIEASVIKSSRFDRWVGKTVTKLNENSYLVQTALGPVEYAWHGEGPVIVSVHGGFGGYDQGLAVADFFVKEGYSILAVSRPGYLRTPLPPLLPNVEFTPAQQADIIAALLDALNIPEVVALGFSAGGPVAFEFAKRYPTKAKALVLESISQQPGDSPLYEVMGSILTQPVLPDLAAYFLYESIQIDFYSVLKQALSQDTALTGDPLATRTRYVMAHSNQYKLLKKLLKSMKPISARLPGILNDFLGVNYWEGPNFNPTGFTVPTVIVQSVDDVSGYFPGAQSVNNRIVGSQLIPVLESGHFIWLGPQTKVWQAQVAEFLEAYKPVGFYKPDSA